MRKEELLKTLKWKKVDGTASGLDSSGAIAHSYMVKAGKKDTLVTDLYYDGCPVARICLTDNSYRNYFPVTDKWTSKKLSTYSYGYREWEQDSGCRISLQEIFQAKTDKESAKVLWEYIGREVLSPVREIRKFEDRISEQRASRRYEKRKEKLHSRMELVRNPSKKFLEWAKNRAVQHRITILPYKGKNTTTGICSACGAENVFGSKLKSQQKIICPSCKKEQ